MLRHLHVVAVPDSPIKASREAQAEQPPRYPEADVRPGSTRGHVTAPPRCCGADTAGREIGLIGAGLGLSAGHAL